MKTENQNASFKYLTLITTLIITIGLVMTFVETRLFEAHHILLASDSLLCPFFYVLFDICAEVYGYKISRQILWCTLLSFFISAILIFFIIRLPSPNTMMNFSHQFNFVMRPYFSEVIWLIISILAGQFINIYLLVKLKIVMRGKYFWLRSVSTTFIGDCVTNLISSVYLIGRMPLHYIFYSNINTRITITLIQAIIAIPAIWVVAFLKKAENVDAYDVGTNFNPFKLSLKN